MEEIAAYLPAELSRLPFHDFYQRSHAQFEERDGWLLPARFRTIQEEMDLLERGKSIMDFSDHGLLRLEGSNAPDFLNRISTNDFGKFAAGGALQTVLTTEKGRVVGVVTAFHAANDVLLLVDRGAQAPVKEWIEKFIIAEDLKVYDETGQHVILAAINPDDPVSLSDAWAPRAVYRTNISASMRYFVFQIRRRVLLRPGITDRLEIMHLSSIESGTAFHAGILLSWVNAIRSS